MMKGLDLLRIVYNILLGYYFQSKGVQVIKLVIIFLKEKNNFKILQ